MTLHWERQGEDDRPDHRLLLINGLGSSMVAFEQGFIDELVQRDLTVIRFDNRDVGKSPRHPEGYTLSDMVDDAAGVLDEAGWSSAHVLGQSMGGMIAQQLAVECPDRVRSLISLMSSTGNPAVGRPTEAARAALLASPPTDPEGWLANRLETEKIWCSPEFWDPVWVEAKARAMLAHGIDVAGAVRQYRAVAGSGIRDEGLTALDVATLVIHGSADTLITPSGGRHTAQIIPGARYVEIDGMGHDLPPALWARLADEVATFVDASA